MSSQSFSILFLTKYARMGASSRYRSWQYLPALEARGIRCEVSPLFNDDYLSHLYSCGRGTIADMAGALRRRIEALFKVRQYNLLWLEKELFPYSPAICERMLTTVGIPYIVDYDDALFHQYNCHHSLWVRHFFGKKIAAVMYNASLVIAGNEYLADYGRKAGARQVEVLPTVVDLDRYRLTSPSKHSAFTIGWIGSPSTSKYLKEIALALAEVCRDGRVKVVLIGAGEVDLPGVPVVRLPWSEDSEVANIQGFDVGIMPLVDRPWERGKCGFKLIQYMACSLPVVASPVGVNSEIVEPGINGFLATTTQDWVQALTVLRDRPKLRKKMGIAGRKKVESLYCLQVTAPRLLSLLQSTLNQQ